MTSAIEERPPRIAHAARGATERPVPPWTKAEPEYDTFLPPEILPGEETNDDTPPENSIGTMTAFDLPYGPTPDQMVDPYLTPDGVTILYGKGGTGKGVTASWLTQQLVAKGNTVMILDFEFHQREWGQRLRGLGMTDEDLRNVHWRSPSSDDWTARKGTLEQVWPSIREDCDRLGVSVIVVDSYTVATSGDDSLGGQSAAQDFFSAMSRIGRPALVIAHVKGDAQRFPDKPFGSVFVHNLARETWAIEANAATEWDPADEARLQPHVIELELRNKKANGRQKAPPQFLAFSFHHNGDISVDNNQPNRARPLHAIIEEVLRKFGPMTVDTLSKALTTEYQRDASRQTINKTFQRHADTFVETTATYPQKWGVRGNG